MEVNTKSILQMAGGAIMERVDYEMPLIVANISDPNTPTKTKRKLTVTLEFSVDESRQNIQVKAHSKSTLAPTEPVTTFLYISVCLKSCICYAYMRMQEANCLLFGK